MAYIKIKQAKVDNTTELAHFFGIMKCGVTSLNPGSFDNNPFTFKPMRCNLVLDISKQFNDSVFLLKTNRMCKFYV